jgi:phosphoenolpyruvate-protein kinase (PTS system EI component)
MLVEFESLLGWFGKHQKGITTIIAILAILGGGIAWFFEKSDTTNEPMANQTITGIIDAEKNVIVNNISGITSEQYSEDLKKARQEAREQAILEQQLRNQYKIKPFRIEVQKRIYEAGNVSSDDTIERLRKGDF